MTGAPRRTASRRLPAAASTMLVALVTVLTPAGAASAASDSSGPAAPAAADVPAAVVHQGPSRHIVVLHDRVEGPSGRPVAVDPGRVGRELARRAGTEVDAVYRSALQGFIADLTPTQAAALSRDRRVAYVERDRAVWAYDVPTGVDRIEADRSPAAGIDGSDERVDVDVAVLDTGIAPHPDLNVAGGANCTSGRCSTVRRSADGNGHGTHVAGTVGALDDGRGAVGVAPGARLWAIKVLRDTGSGTLSAIIAGIDLITANADTIEVANASLGCDCYSRAMNDALTRAAQAGVVVVAAAGNSSRDGSGFTPAGHPDVIGVTAIADYDGRAGGGAGATCADRGPDDSLADFSNYGEAMDLAAPGVCIASTWPGGGYRTVSGTSMASPHVAGAAALVIAESRIAAGPSRAAQVQAVLVDEWSVPQEGACGFTGGRSPEPLLHLVPCGT